MLHNTYFELQLDSCKQDQGFPCPLSYIFVTNNFSSLSRLAFIAWVQGIAQTISNKVDG